MISSLRKNLSHLDSISIIGFFLSIACAIHCLALPILILMAPMTGIVFFENEALELVVLAASVFITAISLFYGYKNHKNFSLVGLFFIAILILLISNFFIVIFFKPWTDALGAISLATTLFWNMKLNHNHSEECKH